jgi:pimeloyl-ACP methyl ester carboxylesterase
MTTLLALALCLAPQVGRPLPPSAPKAPQLALRRLFTYDPLVYGLNITNGSFHELELGTPDGPERFGLYVPNVPVVPASPLLVHFHAFNGGHTDLLFFAQGMLEEADARGWILVAPDQSVRNALGQADGKTYGSDEAQRRVQAVLGWVLAALPVDRNRIYGYGFSMGGGDCLSYAAQHLDPERGAFAAVINHTGTLVLTEEWTRSPPARTPLESVFAGTPAISGYAYRRASTIEFPWSPISPGTFTGTGRHAAENLFVTPTRSWYHTADTAFQRTEEFMLALDTLVLDHEIEYPATLPPPPTGPAIPHHAWEYLDPVAACNWFAGHTLSVPTAGTVHFSRNARYHDLELTRKSNDAFGSVSFNVPQSGTVRFVGISNVLKVRIDAARSQLSTQGGLIFDVGRDTHPNHLGRPVIVEITNLGFTPSSVVQWNLSPGDAEPHSGPIPGGGFGFYSRATNTAVDTIELRP